MDDNQLGLFELPPEDHPPKARSKRRGQNRQVWARTVTAEVTVVDPSALMEAEAQAVSNAITLDHLGEPDPVPATDSPDEALETNFIEVLCWLIFPGEACAILQQAGAFWLFSMDTRSENESDNRATVIWSVRVQLKDVAELRKRATEAHPESADQIADDLAVAWNCAADPFEPLQSIPGITWQPGQVEVEHLPAREAWKR